MWRWTQLLGKIKKGIQERDGTKTYGLKCSVNDTVSCYPTFWVLVKRQDWKPPHALRGWLQWLVDSPIFQFNLLLLQVDEVSQFMGSSDFLFKKGKILVIIFFNIEKEIMGLALDMLGCKEGKKWSASKVS